MIAKGKIVTLLIAILGITGIRSVQANPALPLGVWTNITPSRVDPSTVNVFALGMAIDAKNPLTIYVGVCGNSASGQVPGSAGIYKTTDGGSSWTKKGHIASGSHCADTIDEPIRVRCNPRNPQQLYCGDGVRGCSGGFWVSNDGGDNWSMPAGFETWAQNIGTNDVYDIAVDPDDFKHVLLSFHSGFRTTGSGVAETFDGGNTWLTHAPAGSGGAGMSVWFLYRPDRGIGNNRTWLLGTQYDGYWRTTDAGTTWNKVAANPIAHGGGQIYYARNNMLYATTDGHVMRSSDNGITWASISSSPMWHNGLGGDGTRIYTCGINGPTKMMMSTPESDGANWTTYTPAQSFQQCPFEMAFDSVNNIMYNSSWADGIWALKVQVTQPTARMSGAPIAVTYVRGGNMAAQSHIVTIVNPYGSQGMHLPGPVTVSKKSAWLTLAVNATNVDSQVITNTINPASLPDAEAKYYDTVTVHAAGTDATDQTYFLQLWIKNQSILNSIVVTPGSPIIAGSQSVQLAASALDQYGEILASQPVFTWTTTSGTIGSNGLYTSEGCSGTFTAMASASGKSGSATITVTDLNASQAATATASTGPQVNAMKDGIVSGHPVDGTKEWISNGEKAGAWAQLSWTNPISIDSVSLWDRPNVDDQVLSGTLTFSDGSSIAVGALSNDASSPWSTKFSSKKSVTWVKFTVNTVKTTTANIGLAEFGVYNTNSCTVTNTNPPLLVAAASKMLEISSKGILVNASEHDAWCLDLFGLNGVRIARISGVGISKIMRMKELIACGSSIARLTSKVGVVVERVVR